VKSKGLLKAIRKVLRLFFSNYLRIVKIKETETVTDYSPEEDSIPVAMSNVLHHQMFNPVYPIQMCFIKNEVTINF